MNPLKIKVLVTVILLSSLLTENELIAKKISSDNKRSRNEINNTRLINSRAKLNISNISTWFNNNGESDYTPDHKAGFEFPIGSKKTSYFISGFLWGGKVNGEIRVGGSTYNHGLLPGAVINGQREDDAAAHVRIYRVRRDYKSGNLTKEAIDENLTVQEVYDQYEIDWNEWPAQYGAPYEDIDRNGNYDPNIDIPGQPGADQTIWFVANDLDSITSQVLYGSMPMGIEMQATIWAYKRDDEFGDMIFRKYQLVNESQKDITDMYLSMWSDPNIGDFRDDLFGSDSILNLGYFYNANGFDNQYGTNSPSVGFQLLQGPIVDSPTNVAFNENLTIRDKKNLNLSSVYYTIYSDAELGDPSLGEKIGATQFYNLFQGKTSKNGNDFINPNTNIASKFPYNDNPFLTSGLIDKISNVGDKSMGLSSGPFTFAAGDTQTVIYAQIAHQGENFPKSEIINYEGMRRKASSLKTFIKNRYASIIKSKTIVKNNEKIDLNIETIYINQSDKINFYQWTLNKPDNSNAILIFDSTKATFTPDVEGFYEVILTTKTTSGKFSNANAYVFSTTNKPPIPDFTIDRNEIEYGEFINVDASITTDIDNDKLYYEWGNWLLTNQYFLNDSIKAQFTPAYGSRIPITLSVNDGSFSVNDTQYVNVKPKLNKIDTLYSLNEQDLAARNYILSGDTLITAIFESEDSTQSQKLKFYTQSGSGYVLKKTVHIPNINSLFALYENYLFIGIRVPTNFNLLNNRGAISVYRIDEQWNLTNVLDKYLPDSSITDKFKIIDNKFFVKSLNNNLYKIDFLTNISSPQIVEFYESQPGSYIYDFYQHKDYLITHGSGNSAGEINVVDINSLNKIGNLSYRSFITYSKNHIFIIDDINVSKKSISIYNLDSNFNLVKLNEFDLEFPSSISKIDMQINRINYIYSNEILEVVSDKGLLLYNIKDIFNPKLVGSFWQGWFSNIVENKTGNLGIRTLLGNELNIGRSMLHLIDLNNIDNLITVKYKTSWSGNPYQPMNLIINSAKIENKNLSIGDEIGVFDGNVCIGVSKLISSLNEQNPLNLTLSMDDPTTNIKEGFSNKGKLIFKIWKKDLNKEFFMQYNIISGLDYLYANATSVVELFTPTNIKWQSILELSDQGGLRSGDSLMVGQDPTGTDGLDTGLGEVELPPAPPSGTFDASLLLPDNSTRVKKDIRSSDSSSVVWRINFQSGSSGYPITLRWDRGSLPEGSFVLKDLLGGLVVNQDMKLIDSLVISNQGVTGLLLEYNESMCLEVVVNDKWNLMSVPLEGKEMLKDSLYKSSVSSAFYFDNGYKVADTMKVGLGYWLKFDGLDTVSICGMESGSLSSSVKVGWNMIGGGSKAVGVSSLVSTPSNIIVSDLFEFNNGYKKVDTLRVGKGYWVKVNQEGSIGYGSGLVKGRVDEEEGKDWGVVIVSDVSGEVGRLYTGNEGIGKYELPPLPPTGIKDVRYSTSTNVLDLSREIGIIEFRSLEYPIKISVKRMTVNISDISGGKLLSNRLNDGETLKINNASITKIKIEEAPIPTKYQLEQNYPNPFNPSTKIKYSIPEKTRVRLEVYNVLGERVAKLVDRELEGGYQEVEFNASHLSSGVYIYKLHTSNYTNVKKMLLLK